jgi:hypothetical protein
MSRRSTLALRELLGEPMTSRVTAEPGDAWTLLLQQPLQLFRSHPDVGKNSAKCSSGHVTALVNRAVVPRPSGAA